MRSVVSPRPTSTRASSALRATPGAGTAYTSPIPLSSELHCARTRSDTLRVRRAKPLACEHERRWHRDAPVLGQYHVHRDVHQQKASEVIAGCSRL
jgi:hypothetical protein